MINIVFSVCCSSSVNEESFLTLNFNILIILQISSLWKCCFTPFSSVDGALKRGSKSYSCNVLNNCNKQTLYPAREVLNHNRSRFRPIPCLWSWWSNKYVVCWDCGTFCRACRSSTICWAASLTLGCTLEASWLTRAWRSGSSSEEPRRSSASSSNSTDCKRRREWRRTSHSLSVRQRDQTWWGGWAWFAERHCLTKSGALPTIQQHPDERQESWMLTDVLQPFNTDAHIIKSHQH